MGKIILMQAELGLDTRRQTHIENHMNRDKPFQGVSLEIKKHKENYPNAVHRPVGPCSTYNCHGLTFGSRRTWIANASEIAKIIEEDDYEEVDRIDILPGDIAVYFVNGDAEHSGIVVKETDRGPLILSKWGSCHEVVHLVYEAPYDASSVNYYRVTE